MRNTLFLGAAVAALAMPVAAHAQETTSVIRGTVTAGGTPVAGAQITVTNVPSGSRSTTTTDANGSFNLPGLRVGGPFTVDVASTQGASSVTDIFTVVGQPYDVPIEIGDTGADIIVTASSIKGAGTTSDGPQTVLTRADIAKVASVNRDVRDLARRDPFATLDLSNNNGRAVTFAGINPRFNRFSVNGVAVSDNFGLNQDANPTRRGPVPLDSISQFTVSVAPYDFRQGNFTGGAIDSVLLSGTNEFHGTGFYSQNSDSLSGNKIGSAPRLNLDFKSETYGATLSGPIIKDKLFLMVSAERSESTQPFAEGIGAEGAGTPIPGLTRAQVTNVQNIAQSVYGYEAGDIVGQSVDKDEKIVGRLDWNITDGQKLSLSYINAYDQNISTNNLNSGGSTPSIGLESNAYRLTELLRSGILQLNSDWTDNFSTEARFLYKSYERGQDPLFGKGFAQFRVCQDATSNGSATACGTGVPTIAFGPDNSRQSNEFYTDTYGGSVLARLNMNDHDVKLLFEYNETRIFNLFLQNTAGNYYFDSIDAFANQQATQLIYQDAVSLVTNDAAADFKYKQFTFGAQDDWRVTDRLNVTYGFRYDLYSQRSSIPFNPNFQARYGFPNTKTLKGLGLIQPRAGFDWEAIDDFKIRGGAGVFGGGSPDVYIANSYSNTGIVTNSIALTRNPDGTFAGGASPSVSQDALNGVTGTSIADSVRNFLSTNTASLVNAPVNAIDPSFDIPSVLKATLSGDWTPRSLLGGGWTFGADYYYSNTLDAVLFYDLRSVPIGTLPDGRTRFGPIETTTTNTDILLTNTTRGRSHVGVIRVQKDFDFGLNLGASYTRQDVKDQVPATASTAGSNYSQGAFLGGLPGYGTSNDETKWSFKYNVGFDHAFFGDYRTVFQLFGETSAGRPYSFTMQDTTANRSAVFGLTQGRNDRYLLYVPTGTTDAIVSYDSTATQDAVEKLINTSVLGKYRGKIAPRNIARSAAFTRIDLHLEQEIPTFLGKSRITLFGDIENLPNMLNNKWGQYRRVGFPQIEDVVRVQCLAVATPTGTAPGAGVVATAPTQPCAQYRYSSYIEPNERALANPVTNSLYLIRVGARFTF